MTSSDGERFVLALRNHMQSWGIAALGGSWIPVLEIEVAPGAEPQLQRLQQLLDDSGIQFKRSQR